MSKLYIYTDETRFVIGSIQAPTGFRSSTLVFQTSQGPLGFDSAEGSAALEALIGHAVLLEKANHPERAIAAQAVALKFVRWHASRGVVAIDTPSEWLLNELTVAEAASRQRKANAVRLRLNRSPVEIAPGFFDTWITNQSVSDSALACLLQNALTVSIWCHGEWGIYGKVYSREQELSVWLKRANDENISLVLCETPEKLPSW